MKKPSRQEIRAIAKELDMSESEIELMIDRALAIGHEFTGKSFDNLMTRLKSEKQNELMTKFKQNDQILRKNGEVLEALKEQARPKNWLENLQNEVKLALKQQENVPDTTWTTRRQPSPAELLYSQFTSGRLNTKTKEDTGKTFYEYCTFAV